MEAHTHGKIIASQDQVDARIGELATEIIGRYAGAKPLFVCPLRGGVPFAARLMSEIARRDPEFHPEMDYVMVQTYGQGRTAGDSRSVLGLAPSTSVSGRATVIVDDTLDTGRSVAYVADYLRSLGAVSVDLIVLVEKEVVREGEFKHATISGFAAPDVWITGMGLDDSAVAREGNRWLGLIAESKQ